MNNQDDSISHETGARTPAVEIERPATPPGTRTSTPVQPYFHKKVIVREKLSVDGRRFREYMGFDTKITLKVELWESWDKEHWVKVRTGRIFRNYVRAVLIGKTKV